MTTLEKTQEPTFITKPAFTVVGLRIHTKPKSPEIPKLWDEFVPRMGELQNVSEPYASYGVMAGVDDGLDYMAGNPVSEISELPAGMSRWDIAETTYAVFEATLATLPETFDTIFGTWLPTSGYQQGSGPLLERYGETFSLDNPVLSIYLPVEKKM
jgi:AraC family transcriptional regulator